MKKLFTLALVLLVATMGYAQVRKVSKNDAKNKVATMQVTKGTESSENVQSKPNKTRTDGELDYTTYDWQTNWGNINRTIVWPDGKISFAYTMSHSDNFVDIGTAIGTYDSNTDEWIPLGGRIENEKTNYGSIARYRENGIVVASQTNTLCGVYIVEDKDDMTPECALAAGYLDPTYDPFCPVVMTSGPNRDIIHVVATANVPDEDSTYVPGAEGANKPIIYFRSMDGGQTWDKQNVILPYLSNEYGVAWGPHVCYWMETTEDNCLALVVNNPWSDGMVIYSYDNGDTWERKMFYHHPGIYSTFGDWFMYPRWTSCVWSDDNELCVAYEFNCSTGGPYNSINYDPSVGGVAFWSESLPHQGSGQPFIMDSDYIGELWASTPIFNEPPYDLWPEYFGYLTEADTTGEFNIEDYSLHGDYNCGPVAMPVLCKVPINDNFLVAVWIALDENNMDGAGNYYYKLWGAASINGGHTWFPQVLLVDDFMYQYNECVYPQAAVIGTTLVVVCQMDNETGTYINENELDSSDNYFQGLTFDISGFIPPVPPPSPHYADSEWYYEIVWNDGGITYQHLECAGDTTINNERPKVIVRSNTHYDRDTIFEVTHEYVFEESGFVYWWNRELQEFTTLYDLNAEVGDEWEIMVGLESLTLHVDAVRYIEYEGRTYRTLTVSDPEDLFSGDIVCGIGHLTSFFPEQLMNRDKGFRVDGLRCYWEEGELVFKIGTEDCDAIFDELHGIDEDGPSIPSTSSGTARTLTIYPNPTNGILFVETCGRASLSNPTYRITNLMGQTLQQGCINADCQQINIENLSAGLYFITAGEKTVKFVKQ